MSVFGSHDSEDEVSKERVREIAGERYDEDEFRKLSGGKSFIPIADFKRYLLALETLEESKCKVTIEEAREIAGDLFDEDEFRKSTGSNGCMTMINFKKYLLLLESPKDLSLNYNAIKSLWFAADGGRGRCLVDVKDTVMAGLTMFHKLFMRFSEDPSGMRVSEFHKMVELSNCGLDDGNIDSHFYECTAFPESDDDTGASFIQADLGKFISAVIRVANAVDFQNNGMSDKSLRQSLIDWLTSCSAALGITAEELVLCVAPTALRDRSFFDPPDDFSGSEVKVFMRIESADGMQSGTVVFELNTVVTPKTSFNFKCLCTGERSFGEITGLPLSYVGSSIHRIVPGMCVQGGDIEGYNGFGGESIYGGDFNDENFVSKHDAEGVLSMGNQGPNTNNSQFFVTLAPCHHLDGENVAFGRVVEGIEFIQALGMVEVDEDNKATIQQFIIKECGVVQ